jgi:GT2 family glycosyltransferase
MIISAYVPFYNDGANSLKSLTSLAHQDCFIEDIFAVDDGSLDRSAEAIVKEKIRVIKHSYNMGRGAARKQALLEAQGEIIVSCDATNILPADFVSRLLLWFDDPKVAAVFGRIQDPQPKGVVARWRARHLFKADHPMTVRHQAPLITYGTIVRRSAVMEVGNFDPALRHSEDAELGERLLAAGYDIVFDPSVPVFCNVQNSLAQVLERYWRWYAGKDEQVSLRGYWHNVIYSIKGMAWQDFKAGDPLAAMISLVCPHYQHWKSRVRRAAGGGRQAVGSGEAQLEPRDSGHSPLTTGRRDA